jgi:hypothetical protein
MNVGATFLIKNPAACQDFPGGFILAGELSLAHALRLDPKGIIGD